MWLNNVYWRAFNVKESNNRLISLQKEGKKRKSSSVHIILHNCVHLKFIFFVPLLRETSDSQLHVCVWWKNLWDIFKTLTRRAEISFKLISMYEWLIVNEISFFGEICWMFIHLELILNCLMNVLHVFLHTVALFALFTFVSR